jgi:phosphoribosylamine-glycine ligase
MADGPAAVGVCTSPLADEPLEVGSRSVRVLVIGGGGREHAIVRGLAADPAVSELHCAPGNPGIAASAQPHSVSAGDPQDVLRLARQLAADLVVIGPEAPLVAGVADALRGGGDRGFRARRAGGPHRGV